MKTETKTLEIYIARDGKQFLDKRKCGKYENTVLAKLDNIKYYCYLTNRDLNETGRFYNKNYAAVYTTEDIHEQLLLQYLIDKHDGHVLSHGVQGCGVTNSFEYYLTSAFRYFEAKPNIWGGTSVAPDQIFISHVPVDGFPPNIDIASKYVK